MGPEGSLPCKQQSLVIAVLSQINPITIFHVIDLRSFLILLLLFHALLDVPRCFLIQNFCTEKLQAILFASLRHARTGYPLNHSKNNWGKPRRN
jgi:hypothetical protein